MPSLTMLSSQDLGCMLDSSSSDSPTLSDSRNESAPLLPRRPIPRKGHTKSRRGCYNCKRRRIKCSERHPECNHCIKAGLQCEYPANIIQATQRSHISPHPQGVGNLRSTPGMFVSVPQAFSQLQQYLTITVHVRYALVPSLLDYRISALTRRSRQDLGYYHPEFCT
jgi:hypothetical protein